MDTSSPEPSLASLELMRLLEEHPDCSQRELSRRMGVSLGKTHYLLRALLEKGWVKAQNFQPQRQQAALCLRADAERGA